LLTAPDRLVARQCQLERLLLKSAGEKTLSMHQEVQVASVDIQNKVAELRDEFNILRRCLVDAGVLRSVHFLISGHKERFEAIKQTSGWHSKVNARDVLCSQKLFNAISDYSDNASKQAMHVLTTQRPTGKVRSMPPLIAEHKTRFEAVKQASKWHPEISIESVLGTRKPWTTISEYTGAASKQAMHMVSSKLVKENSSIYICGGVGEGGCARKAALCFDPRRGTWEELPSMVVQRHSPAAGVIAGKLYVCGGKGQASVECFDMSTSKWERRKSMHVPRFGHAAVAFNNNLYVTGGAKAEGHGWHAAERYNPNHGGMGEWVVLPSMSESRYLHSSVNVRGQLVVLGGWSAAGVSELRIPIEVFDPKGNTWNTLPPEIPCPRACMATLVYGNAIYLCGGCDYSGVVNHLTRIDLDRNVIEELPNMRVPRAGHMVFVAGGALHVFGGVSLYGPDFPDARPLASVEKFDLRRQAWVPLRAMQDRMAFFAGART